MAQQIRSEETRARILSAALGCFARFGYDASGVAEICAAAGVSKGAFYHHFPSKQAVFVELLNDWLKALDERFTGARGQSRSVPAALREMARAARQVFTDARGQLPMFFEFWTQATRDPAILARTIEPYQRYEHYFAEMIQAGIDEGSLRPVEPVTAARTVIALAVGLLVQGLASPNETDWASAAESGMEMLLRGIETRAD